MHRHQHDRNTAPLRDSTKEEGILLLQLYCVYWFVDNCLHDKNAPFHINMRGKHVGLIINCDIFVFEENKKAIEVGLLIDRLNI